MGVKGNDLAEAMVLRDLQFALDLDTIETLASTELDGLEPFLQNNGVPEARTDQGLKRL